jgi:pimeloyl-ACP methyl ester carboxylesterase
VAPSRDAQTITLEATDGVRLAAVHLAGPDAARPLAVVVGHGFTQSTARPGTRAVLEALAEHAGVIGIDFRGHGASAGLSTVGHEEVLDVAAAVSRARELGYADVVTCGWSMGGSIVLRHAALHGGVEGVVSVSAVSRWFYKDTKPMRRVHWAIETRIGRLVTRRMLRTRITDQGWPADEPPEPPVEVIGRISPIPVLIVHGDQDHYFPVEHPKALYEAAREPKELWLVEGFAHAETGASPELLDRIGRHLPELVAQGRRSAADHS